MAIEICCRGDSTVVLERRAKQMGVALRWPGTRSRAAVCALLWWGLGQSLAVVHTHAGEAHYAEAQPRVAYAYNPRAKEVAAGNAKGSAPCR